MRSIFETVFIFMVEVIGFLAALCGMVAFVILASWLVWTVANALIPLFSW